MMIYKRTIQVVLYSRDPFPKDGDVGLWGHDALIGWLKDASEGSDIGDWNTVSDETLTDPASIRSELVAIGNDGSFFDDDETED